MVGARDWAGFEDEATDFRNGKGVVLHRSSLGGDEAELLGVTHFSAATWSRLTAAIGEQDLDVEVPKVLATMREAAELVAAGRPEHRGGAEGPSEAEIGWYQATQIMGMRTTARWRRADGSEAEIPRLAGALSDTDDGARLHEPFRSWLTHGSDAFGMGRGARGAPSEEVIRGILEVKQAMWKLDMLGRVLRPAQTARQSSNAELIGDLALDTFAASVRDLVRQHDDDHEGAMPRLRGMMARLDALREALTVEADRAAEVRRDWLGSHGIDDGDDEEAISPSP